ncbi:MAG: hypothetical protein AB7T31_04530 [Gemmatimonadales bacterium]
MTRRPSIILIREWDEQTSGVRCVGRVRKELFQSPDPVFAERRAIMERMGELYRMLRYRFQKRIDLQVVDPRNAALPFVLIGEFFTHRVGLREALRTLFRMPPHAVLVNGRIVDVSEAPDIPAIVALVASAADAP